MKEAFPKKPNAVLDYRWDFAPTTNGSDTTKADWLASGETITSHTVTPDAGLTVDSSSRTDASTSVTAWFSGGTADVDYDVVCNIVTSAGRTDGRTIEIRVRER